MGDTLCVGTRRAVRTRRRGRRHRPCRVALVSGAPSPSRLTTLHSFFIRTPKRSLYLFRFDRLFWCHEKTVGDRELGEVCMTKDATVLDIIASL